jgi:hypothetical protein
MVDLSTNLTLRLLHHQGHDVGGFQEHVGNTKDWNSDDRGIVLQACRYSQDYGAGNKVKRDETRVLRTSILVWEN